MDSHFSELLSRVVDAYRRALAQSPPAREWLAGRGIRDAALLERFRVGYSEGKLPAMARGEVLGRLQALGLLDPGGRERFSGSIVVPVFDGSGQVVQLAGYAPDGAVTWLFPAEAPGFWNADAFRSGREIAIVSDPLAGLVEIGAGRDAVVAPGGPGMPLGQGAKDQLLAQPVKVTLLGCEGLRPELETLGVLSKKVPLEDASVERASDGFFAAFPRRLQFAVQGLSQDSARHLRASVRVFRQAAEGKSPASPGHVDTLDLYHARSRTAFAKTAACLLGEDPILFEEFMGRIIGLAEEFLREREKAAPLVVLSEDDRNQALRLLRDPRYPESVVEDLTRLGYVGEAENKLVAYLASLSRKLEDPLSILVVSRSAAGKSTLSEAISAMAPPEDVLRFTRLTAQTLYYQKPDSLKHKMVVIEEEKGVEDAAYALRVLQSAKHLSLSTASGKGDARRREVRGPVSLFVTTTRTDLDEETAGRFLTLSVDESKEQTRAIITAQREAEARSPAEKEHLLKLHQNAQRLLQPVKIVNPYAPRLTFPDDRLSARRDHGKYLGLIRAMAFARQFQREAKDGAIEVTLDDLAHANRLAHHTLGQSLYDLTPSSRRLLLELRDWLKIRGEKEGTESGAVRFSQRELREHIGWKKTQLAHHVRELLEAEYLVVHVSGPGRRTRYALDWDGGCLDGERFYRGLVDPSTLDGVHTSGSLPGHDRSTSGMRKRGRPGPETAITPESTSSDRTSGKKGSR
jgi:hypothetical protein